MNDVKGKVYTYGNYYNWYAATAMTGVQSMSIPGDSAGSICPVGWNLPKGGNVDESGSFYHLGSLIDDNIQSYPNNFVYSGSDGGSFAGEAGDYWSGSATGFARNFAVYLEFGNASINYGHELGRSYGYTVRCLLNT